MKKFLILCSITLLVACTSNTEKPQNAYVNANDTLNADLNNLNTHTLFDSIPREKLTWCDSLSIADGSPTRKIKLNARQISFLKLRNLRDFAETDTDIPDKSFSLVCRLPLSRDYFSIILNYKSENESMNYLINYDRNYNVIDYVMTAFADDMDKVPRIRATIDTAGLTVTTYNAVKPDEPLKNFRYSITGEGFFREMGVLAEK